VTQYIQQNLSNIYETAEELAAMGNEWIAFYVTAANFQLCSRLTTILKEMDECTRVVWFGSGIGKQGGEIIRGASADGLILWKPEHTLYHLLHEDNEQVGTIDGYISRDHLDDEEQLDERALPRTEELLDQEDELDQFTGVWEEAVKQRLAPIHSIKCADSNGPYNFRRTHSVERFRQDLELTVQTLRQKEARLKVEGIHLLDLAARNSIYKVLEEMKDRISYAADVPLEWVCDSDELRRWVQAGITLINARVPVEISQGQLAEAESAVETLRRITPGVKLSVVLINKSEIEKDVSPEYTEALLKLWIEEGLIEPNNIRLEIDSFSGVPTKFVIPEPIAQFLIEYLRDEDQQALLNGYLAYMTGNYPHQAIGGGVKHIGYSDGSWNTATVNRLGEYSGVNSALLFEYNQVNGDFKSEIIIADQDGVWKRENETFDRLLRTAKQENYYLSNAHQIIRQGEYDYELQLNDFLHIEPLQVRNMNYSQAQILDPNGDEVQFQYLNIVSEADLELFLQDVELFSKTGMFRHGYEIQSYLIDGCRWSGAHMCRAKQLPRLFIDQEDQISPCRGCAAIGGVGDSLDSLLTQVSIITDEEQLLRGCRTCEIKDSCSKCSFLPEYMNRQQYCDLRRKHGMLHRYMQLVQVFKGLRKYTQSLQGISVRDIRVSLPTCTHVWSRPKQDRVSSPVIEAAFLFFIGEQPLLFQAVSQKILKLNEPMAFILEGLMVGASELELEQELKNRYQVDQEFAAKLVAQAIDLFAREGCLQTPAKAV